VKPKLLIHTCCANCLCFTYKYFENDFELLPFWFNPNIHPYSEYKKRLDTLYVFQAKKNCSILYDETYDPKRWLLFTKEGWENNNKNLRCKLCYKLRLEKTAEKAKELGIENFTTTLLYSKYQFHDDVKNIGFEIANEYKLKFVYADLRVGWKEGIKISKELGLYRQKYCGCIFSEIEF
jgi:predicted adenine nucleotide alpha hydrolase (AANH) superfamily ATPase